MFVSSSSSHRDGGRYDRNLMHKLRSLSVSKRLPVEFLKGFRFRRDWARIEGLGRSLRREVERR
ncbi:unnamed protein product [Prunus armeniaca]|uniref:Uncharacterized protein n=1 Tax=Prunus armeniaca TaxID=36596 RepID=A0A6J5TJB6_PRUAR|nr:unnamed protein product [Prunus armeniaca]